MQTFESLPFEFKFAVQSYSLSFAALDKAGTGSEGKDIPVAMFVPAGLPEYAELLHGVLGTLFLFLGGFVVWSLSLLVGAGVKDYVF